MAAQEDGGELFSVVISAIAKDDPMKAGELFREALMNGTVDGRSIYNAAYSISRSLGELGAIPLLEFADSLPQRQQSNAIHNAMRAMSDTEQIKLLSELRQRSADGTYDGARLDYAFAIALGSNREMAEAWLEKLPEGETKVELQLSAANRLMQEGNKEEAGEWFQRAIISSPGREKELMLEAARNIAYSNPEGIALFATMLPPDSTLTADDLKSHALNSIHSGSGGLVAVTDALRNPDEKAKLIMQTLETLSKSNNLMMNATDIEILSRRIDGASP
ncbi:MAG: hypothetical protein ABJQ29_07785 [Luteolibacter sp.]